MQLIKLFGRYWQQAFDIESPTSFKDFLGICGMVLILLVIGGTNLSLLFHPHIDTPHLNVIGSTLLLPMPALQVRRLKHLLKLTPWMCGLLLMLGLVLLVSLGASSLCDLLISPGYLFDRINDSAVFSWTIPFLMLGGIVEGILFSFCFASETE